MANRLRIAVTGGSGRIGTAVVKRLLERGHEPIVLDRRAPKVDGVRFVFIDLRDRQHLQPVLEGCNAVIHLGEIPNANAGESPHDVFVRNTAAGSTVIQTTADLKIPRMIYTSSCQVYGLWGGGATAYTRQRPVKFPIDENQPLSPANAYSLAKVANENFARLIVEQQGLSVAAFRLPHVLGQQQVEHMARWGDNPPAWLKVEKDGLWTFLYVEDAADAYALAIEQPRPGFEAYNLGAADIRSNLPLREMMVGIETKDWPPIPPDWPDRASPMSIEKARQHFGWTPKHSFTSLVAGFTERPSQG